MTRNTEKNGPATMPAEREMQALIGHRLRARYAEVLAEPIPDKFLDLLERLDGKAPTGVAVTDGAGSAAPGNAVLREENGR